MGTTAARRSDGSGRRHVAGVRLRAALALALTAALVTPTGAGVARGAQPNTSTAAAEDVPVRRLAGSDRIGTAVAVSEATHEAAGTAVLARADDFADALVAAPLAAERGAPILLTGRDALAPRTAAELDRLGVEEVLVMGGTAAVGAGVVAELEAAGLAVHRVGGTSRFATAAAVAAELGTSGGTAYVATGGAFPDALAAGPLAADAQAPILLVTRDEIPASTAGALAALEPERIVVLGGTGAVGEEVARSLGDAAPVTRLAGPDRFATAGAVFDEAVRGGLDPGEVWLADARDFPDALVAGPAVAAAGGTLLLVDGRHLASAAPAYARIRGNAEALTRVTVLGGSAAVTGDAAEQVQGVAFGAELPRGGRLLFPQHRMVALYGNARSAAMGALGEQPPEEAAARVERVAQEYAAGGRTLLPTFELIVTVATRAPGPDGLYRSVADPAEVQTYLDVARRHGLYLLLDIQPGRSDFLTEVRRYERFLAEPDVGIALDPEWRMGPGGVPGQGVGTVDAAEVNQVVDHLAAVVRRERLPQKLLVVHQFQDRMITNRDRIRTPDEVAVTFHADGFGSRAAKRSKYESFLAPRPYAMGFKLFYDEDVDRFSAADVLGFRVPPDLVTYQ